MAAAAVTDNTAVIADDDAEDTDADLHTAAKRRCYAICSESDTESDSQPQPAAQQATIQPLQLSDDAPQHATQAVQMAEQSGSDMSEFMSCSSGSDIEVDLELF